MGAVQQAVKVLVIMGWTRSGSTLLDNLLGGIDGFFSAGELHYLWKRGLLENRLCSCGEPVRRCQVWSSVLARVRRSADWDELRVVEWQQRSVRVRHTLRLLRHAHLPTGWPPLDGYAPLAAFLYKAIAEVTGARVIVDSSKRPSDGAILGLLPGIDPYFVHLVRDPRAVAHSWKRHKREADRQHLGEDEEMPRYGSLYCTIGWDELNLASEVVRRHFPPERSLRLRYEDLMDAPKPALQSISNMVNESGTKLPLIDDHTAVLGPNHAVAGNPSRFTTGEIPLRLDTEWRYRLKRSDAIAATALGLPLLPRYGYPVRWWHNSTSDLEKIG